MKVCKCGSEDLAYVDIEPDWLKEWERENAPIKDGRAEAEWYQFMLRK